MIEFPDMIPDLVRGCYVMLRTPYIRGCETKHEPTRRMMLRKLCSAVVLRKLRNINGGNV